MDGLPEDHGAVVLPLEVDRLVRRGELGAELGEAHPDAGAAGEVDGQDLLLGLRRDFAHRVPVNHGLIIIVMYMNELELRVLISKQQAAREKQQQEQAAAEQ